MGYLFLNPPQIRKWAWSEVQTEQLAVAACVRLIETSWATVVVACCRLPCMPLGTEAVGSVY